MGSHLYFFSSLPIDMTEQYPKMLTSEMTEEAHKIIRLCGKDACVWIPEEKTEDWDLEDPLGKPIEKVREIRDIIETEVKNLIAGFRVI
jgi:arsenate reductase